MSTPIPAGMRRLMILVVGCLAVYGAWSAAQQILPARSGEARAIGAQLQQLETTLVAADAKGDRVAAGNLGDPLQAILRNLNTRTQLDSSLENCRLAAVHLVDGMGAVYEGQHWQTRDRFRASLKQCS